MTRHSSDRMVTAMVLFAVLAALVVTAIALSPQAQSAPDRRNVSAAKEDNGLPVWYRDAKTRRVFQCTDEAMCGIEAEGQEPPPTGVVPGEEPPPAEVVYWAGEASIPVGRRGVDLVMAVEGSFMNPDGTDATAPDDDTIPVVESVLLARGSGMKANVTYRITHPYGVMRVRTDNRGRFRKIIEHGCHLEGAGETCNFGLALSSPIFKSFLRWDPKAGPKAPAGFMGDPERPHRVVGSPNGTNYLKVELVRPGKKRDIVIGKTASFSITGQKTRGSQTEPPPPQEEEPPITLPLGV